MPQIIRKPKQFPRRGGNSVRVNWDALRDGRQYRFVAGEDFTGGSKSLRVAAYNAAVRRGMRAQTMTDGDDVIVQFYVPAQAEGGQ